MEVARKPKQGLDYFPLDVDFQSDLKVRKLIYRFGSDAVSVFIMFLNELYKNGYFFDGDLSTLSDSIAYEIGKSGEEGSKEVKKILDAMLSLGMIDEATLELDNVITSKAVQKQFLLSTSRRKKAERKYWLLSEEEEKRMGEFLMEKKGKINVDNNETQLDLCKQKSSSSGVSASDNETDPLLMSTKVHKVKVKDKVKEKVKEKDDKKDKWDIGNCPFQLDYFTKCLISDRIIDVYDLKLSELNDFFIELKNTYDYELVERCFRYTRDYVRKHKEGIIDIVAFFKKAMTENVDKMDGYEERMQKLYDEWEKILEEAKEEKSDSETKEDEEDIEL